MKILMQEQAIEATRSVQTQTAIQNLLKKLRKTMKSQALQEVRFEQQRKSLLSLTS